MKFLRNLTGVIGTLTAFFIYTSCQKSTPAVYEVNTLSLPERPFTYFDNSNGVGGFLRPNEEAALGRVLFYDKNLSINNTISCASCHKQSNGFADVTATSVGFKGGRTTRNSLALVNLSDDRRFFGDLRTTTLEELALQPVSNHIEMGLDNTPNLIKKLTNTPYYPTLFLSAFKSEEITEARISKALAQFLRSIRSGNSRFDAFQNGAWNVLNENETAGWDLFFNKLHCTGCHNGNDFNGLGSGNIGLDMSYKDNGAGAFSGDAALNGVFKVPTLRNIGITAPYMHDGRFKTLEEVVEHYNSGVQNHNNLTRFLRGFAWQGNGGSTNTNQQNCWSCGVGTAGSDFKPLNMTTTEKAQLVAFLKTLTDDVMATDKKFSNPFTN
jgi:cytochrome c peroxidase